VLISHISTNVYPMYNVELWMRVFRITKISVGTG
jgi:hypothetical protein